MAKDNEVRRSETNEGGVHTVREERTTTVKAKTGTARDIPAVSKSSMTYLVPVILAIILALALLSMRSGGITGHKVAPKTWQDSVSETVTGLQDKLNEYTGLGSSSSSLTDGATTKAAKAKAAEAAEKAKAKAKAAAAQAKKDGKPYVDDAADTISAKLNAAKDSAADYVEQLKDKVGIHDTDEAKAKAAKAGKNAKAQASDAADAAKVKAKEAADAAKAKANKAAADAHGKAKDYVKGERSYATQASDYIHDKVDELLTVSKPKLAWLPKLFVTRKRN